MLRPMHLMSRLAKRNRGRTMPVFCEPLEGRWLLSTILWTNRGNSSDNFSAVFGVNATVARNVVDAALASWQRVITSFNLPSSYHDTFDVKISMDTVNGGLGASASLDSNGVTLGGQPWKGTINILHGNNASGDGWFLDPTPYDSSEFTGTIQNAFVGDAPSSSPAYNKADLFTVVAHEMTHLLGLSSDSRLTGVRSLSTNTGVDDTGEPSHPGVADGYYWVFQGADIKHLLTSFDSGGGDLGAPVHSAPAGTVTYGGQTYTGSLDVVNAFFYLSRRYFVPDTIATILKDAYGYTEAPAQSFGTFYDTVQSSGQLLIRGGSSGSNDVINVSQSGSTITVSVNIGNDVPGTGMLPGAGDLPAFVSTFDAGSVSSINIQAGDGNDSIDLSGLAAGIPVTVSGGTGDDQITVHGPVLSAMTITGDAGTNTLRLIDVSSTDNLTVNSSQVLFGSVAITYSNASVILDGGSAISLNSLAIGAGAKLAVVAGASRKSLQIGAGLTLASTATLDLANNAMTVVAGSLSTINSLVTSGNAGGAWNGYGIITSSYHPTVQFTGDKAPWTTLGVGPVGGDVLVMYTYVGDVDLNGVINAADFAQMKNGAISQVQIQQTRPLAYSDGDIDYNGIINAADFALAKSAAINQGSPLAMQSSVVAAPSSANPASSSGSAGQAASAVMAQSPFSVEPMPVSGMLADVLEKTDGSVLYGA